MATKKAKRGTSKSGNATAAADVTTESKPAEAKEEDSVAQVQRGWTGRQLLRLDIPLRRRVRNFLFAAEKQGIRVASVRVENPRKATSVDCMVVDDQARVVAVTDKKRESQNVVIRAVVDLAETHGLECELEAPKTIRLTVAAVVEEEADQG